jgi:hypothetical protein
MKRSKTVCEVREHLEAAYQSALAAARELESQLCAEIASGQPSVRRRAKNQMERAERRSFHFLNELLSHEKKHGCR